MLEVTGDDIAALSDEDLRALVGRLCEAELRRRNLPSSAVTWGGNQTATDGGLDVRVALASGTSIDGFVPKPNTGFQVKKQDMPRAAILDEMKPKGIVRPVIVELANASGAYVIVSSTVRLRTPPCRVVRTRWRKAVEGVAGAANLALDFYDRNSDADLGARPRGTDPVGPFENRQGNSRVAGLRLLVARTRGSERSLPCRRRGAYQDR